MGVGEGEDKVRMYLLTLLGHSFCSHARSHSVCRERICGEAPEYVDSNNESVFVWVEQARLREVWSNMY